MWSICLPVIQKIYDEYNSQWGAHKNKSDDNSTPIKYVIVTQVGELALSRQDIDVSRFLTAAWDFSSARRRFLWESLKNSEERKCQTRLGFRVGVSSRLVQFGAQFIISSIYLI